MKEDERKETRDIFFFFFFLNLFIALPLKGVQRPKAGKSIINADNDFLYVIGVYYSIMNFFFPFLIFILRSLDLSCLIYFSTLFQSDSVDVDT